MAGKATAPSLTIAPAGLRPSLGRGEGRIGLTDGIGRTIHLTGHDAAGKRASRFRTDRPAIGRILHPILREGGSGSIGLSGPNGRKPAACYTSPDARRLWHRTGLILQDVAEHFPGHGFRAETTDGEPGEACEDLRSPHED